MQTKQLTILNLIIPILIVLFLTSCANRPYFIIENKTTEDIKIEFIYDTSIVKDIIATDIISKRPNHVYRDSWGGKEFKDIIDELQFKNEKYIFKYLCDTISLYSLILFGYGPDEFQISNLNKVEPTIYCSYNDEYHTDFSQKAFEYYNFDSTMIKNIIYNNTITLIIPPNFSFHKQCESCGDCSCDADGAFPNAKKVKIIFGKDDDIILTPKNFIRIMNKEKFEGQTDSYVYTVE